LQSAGPGGSLGRVYGGLQPSRQLSQRYGGDRRLGWQSAFGQQVQINNDGHIQ